MNLIERDRELLEAIELKKRLRQEAETGDRWNINALKQAEEDAIADWRKFRTSVVEDLLFALRVTMEEHSLPLSNILDAAYPNLQIRTMTCDVAQIARAVAALEAKVK